MHPCMRVWHGMETGHRTTGPTRASRLTDLHKCALAGWEKGGLNRSVITEIRDAALQCLYASYYIAYHFPLYLTMTLPCLCLNNILLDTARSGSKWDRIEGILSMYAVPLNKSNASAARPFGLIRRERKDNIQISAVPFSNRQDVTSDSQESA